MKTPAEFDIHVVILNFNGGAMLHTVLEAVVRSTGVRLALTLVDNASTDGSGQAAGAQLRAQRQIPWVLLSNDRNLGFAAGNNVGIYAFAARYCVLLNNDAVVEPDALARLCHFLDATPRAGACGPRLVFPDGRPQPFSHGGDPTPLYLARRAVARARGAALHDWAGATPRQVDWVAGTCLALRTAALAQVGLLDESIFMYFEDNDLCLRLRQHGWQVYFVPGAVVRHHNQPSYGDRARRQRYYAGLAHFYTRHYGVGAGLAVRALTPLLLARSG
jgi:N-acetylglucosaminyl-diphospho-decaprenol L-rhamnosyltransferase